MSCLCHCVLALMGLALAATSLLLLAMPNVPVSDWHFVVATACGIVMFALGLFGLAEHFAPSA